VKVAVAGAGALGSVVGGLLADAGEDVVLLAHGGHGDALARRPLELRLPGRTIRVRVRTAEETEADVVILTAKRFDTSAALARVSGSPLLALSLQNGPGKNAELEDRFGRRALLRAATTTAAHVVEPGVVASPSLGLTYLAAASEPARAFAEALRRAGLEVQVVADGAAAEWSKLAHVASSMAVQALVPAPLHELFGRRDAACVLRRLIAEIGSVAEAGGSTLHDLHGLLPVATLAAADDGAAAALLAERAAALERAGATALRTSLLAAIEAGRRTEIEAIHGEVVRRAAVLAIDVPVLETCYRLALARGVRA
jgi:2-dehydropantoate 2-reductase